MTCSYKNLISVHAAQT